MNYIVELMFGEEMTEELLYLQSVYTLPKYFRNLRELLQLFHIRDILDTNN